MFRAKAVIFLVLLAGLTGCSGSSAFHSSLRAPASISQALEQAPDARARLADRFYVASSLSQIYGVGTDNPSIKALVLGQISQFGGSCDQYGQDCSSATELHAPILPAMAPGRSAYLIRVCDSLNAQDALVKAAVKGLGQGQYTTDSAPESDGIAAAYQAFFPERKPAPAVIDALAPVVAASAAQGDAPLGPWRFLLLTLCLAPDWQLP